MKNFAKIGVVLYCSLFVFCASQKVVKLEKNTDHIPVGVDSTLAVKANSIASGILVPETLQNEANTILAKIIPMIDLSDSLWQYYDLFNDTLMTYTTLDSLQAKGLVNIALDSLAAYPGRTGPIKKLQKKEGLLALEALKTTSVTLLEVAHSELERAKTLNPMEFQVLVKDIQVLEKLWKLTLHKAYNLEARQKLNYITQLQKGDQGLYYRLGEVNFNLGDWEKAYENYSRAQTVMERTAIFNITDASLLINERRSIPIDTTQLFVFLCKRAQAKSKLYDDHTALSLLKQAQPHASSDYEKTLVDNFIDWIEWDAGNIRAVEIQDSLNILATTDKLKAKTGYLLLLEMLKTDKAANEIHHKIALIDYQFLNKRTEAADRLLKVIKKAKVDANGAPVDSTYRSYFRDFAGMCYNIGKEYLEQNEYKKAYIYFSQAAAIDWPDRGSSYLRLADLSRLNAAETVNKCNIALQMDLTEQEQQEAYELMVKAYLQLGEFDKARKFYVISQNNN